MACKPRNWLWPTSPHSITLFSVARGAPQAHSCLSVFVLSLYPQCSSPTVHKPGPSVFSSGCKCNLLVRPSKQALRKCPTHHSGYSLHLTYRNIYIVIRLLFPYIMILFHIPYLISPLLPWDYKLREGGHIYLFTVLSIVFSAWQKIGSQ